MIRAYGGKCQCCAEFVPQLLTLEHVEGDGARHRADVGRNAQAQLVDLKRRGWPKEGYTVLCFNCNIGKGTGTSCPHMWPENHRRSISGDVSY